MSENRNHPANSHHTTSNKVDKKPSCFFCKYEFSTKLKSKPKLMNYKNITIKICSTCNKQKFKVCSKNYQSKSLDCSICKKLVLYNTSILCDNCDHYIHRKCTNITHEEIKNIERNSVPWNCSQCNKEIFPFFQLNSTNLTKVLNSKVSFAAPKQKSKAVPVPKNLCFSCNKPVHRGYYNKKHIIYNHKKLKFCKSCSQDQSPLKDKDKIEYLDCTICNKEVQHESIFCILCQSWVHPDCANLTRHDLNTIGEDNYGDWFCPPCTSSIFHIHKMIKITVTLIILNFKLI